MSTFFSDVKYGIRQLVKNPSFTLVAALTLAIGIGANIAMFSVVNAVLLRPLPFVEPDRLVVVQQHSKQYGWTTGLSYPDFLDWRRQNQVFDAITAYTPARFDLTESEGASKINGAMVSGDFFTLLKVPACLGRTFTQADEGQSNERVCLISHEFWRSRFAQDKTVLGRTLTVQGNIYTIVGVLPRGFYYPESIGDAQLWTVLNPSGDQLTNRSLCWLCTVGRLKAGVSIEQAVPLLTELHNRVTRGLGADDAEILMYGLHDRVVRGVRATLWVLSVIVGFILLIVCANVANLCLARASARDKEVAIRRALGADKLRLLCQFTTESLLLSLIGGIVGLVVTVWTITVFKAKIADFVPMADSIHVDAQALCFGLVLCVFIGIILGVTPLGLAHRPRLANVLTERRSASRGHARLSNVMIAGQIAVALVLSIGMVLMIRSVMRLSSVQTGFDRENLITFSIGARGMSEPQRYQLAQGLLKGLGKLPYIKGASMDSSMPCSPYGSSAPVTVEGYTPPDGKPVRAVLHNTGPDYFRTLRIPILKGRDILPAEHEKKEKVVVISENLAKRFWPDRDPIDRELTCCGRQYRVVGIVADMIQANVKMDKPNHLFFPFDALFPSPDLKIVVRSDSDSGAVVEQARAMLRYIDPTLPLYGVSTFKAQMNKCIGQERFTTTFLTVFALIALLLIVVGIYGVVSYAVTQRTREIGIRMALGAQRISILALILKQGLVLSVVGSTVGVAGALGLTRFVRSYLYETSATDPVTFVLAVLLIASVSLLACFIPARRATKVDAMEAMRYE
jgi:predicted permease